MGGILAVNSFYIISGFYMSLILNEKYTGKNSIRLFLSNRLLRIYPIYWLVLILTIITYGFLKIDLNITPFIHLTGVNLILTVILNFVRNVFLISNSAYFLPKAVLLDPLIITPSWTLGLELLFYLIAPFIVRRSLKVILLFGLIAHFLRVIIYTFFAVPAGNFVHVNDDFFLSVFFFFILGIISYKIYVFLKTFNISPIFSKITLLYVVGFTIFYHFFPGETTISRTFYLISVSLSIPVLFKYFASNKIDKFFGDLSYPIYISHMFILTVFGLLILKVNNDYRNIIILATCIIFAFLLHVVVEIPINHYRQGRLVKNKKYKL
jgi:peptidoglycan/LPS O-acetylase OafA/YrhL